MLRWRVFPKWQSRRMPAISPLTCVIWKQRSELAMTP